MAQNACLRQKTCPFLEGFPIIPNPYTGPTRAEADSGRAGCQFDRALWPPGADEIPGARYGQRFYRTGKIFIETGDVP